MRRPLKAFCWILIIALSLEACLWLGAFLYPAVQMLRIRMHERIDEHAFRIVCIGESTTAGYPVVGRGFPEQLGRLLKVRLPARRFQVINLGVIAITSEEISRHFQGNLMAYRPHLVILQAGNNVKNGGIEPFRIKEGPGIRSRLLRAVAQAGNTLKTARLLKFLFDIYQLQRRGQLEIRRVYSDVYLTYSGGQEMYYTRHFDYLDYMRDVAARYKCRMLLCGYPVSGMNYWLREYATERGLVFCDIEQAFERYGKLHGSVQGLLSEDNWHPSEQGYAYIAQELFATITSHNLLEK